MFICLLEYAFKAKIIVFTSLQSQFVRLIVAGLHLELLDQLGLKHCLHFYDYHCVKKNIVLNDKMISNIEFYEQKYFILMNDFLQS